MDKFSELCEINLSKTAISFLTYKFLVLIKKPFNDWEAFKLGLIDEKGAMIKKPKSPKEKESLQGVINLVRKIKKLLGKYIPNEKLLAFLITIYLMKENIENRTNRKLAEKLRSYLSPDENDLIFNILQEHNR